MKTISKFRFLLFIFLCGFIINACEKDEIETPVGKSLTAEVNPIIVEEGSVATVDLIAGQHILAGNIAVSFDKVHLFVTYKSVDDWYLSEVHLWVGTNLEDMPMNNQGSPVVGKFPYKAVALDGSTTYTFTIPLSEFGGYEALCEKNLYVAAHAALYRTNTDGSVDYETGWGNGYPILEQGSWAMYFVIMLNCGDDNNEEPGKCETAFGYGSTTFIDAHLTHNRWGWIYTLFASGTNVTPLYAGAGLNDISKATHVGDVTYIFSGTSLTVRYTVLSGYMLSETHVYASANMPNTIAPGLYGNTHELPNAYVDEFVIPLDGSLPVYVIAHAVVCEDTSAPQ